MKPLNSLKGNFSPPGDKSISHRLALMSLIAKGSMQLSNFSSCDDVNTSLKAIEKLGCDVKKTSQEVIIRGANRRLTHGADIDCGNSGTTMRLLMGILSANRGIFHLDGDESLRKRPMERIAEPLRLMNAYIDTEDGKAPIRIMGGKLKGIEYELPVASAQLKSAILLAGFQAINSTTIIEPAPSRDHTERLFKELGATIIKKGNQITLKYLMWTQTDLVLPNSYYVPGDISSAAFFLCAAAILPDSDIIAEHVLLNPTRTGVLNVLKRMNARIEIDQKGEEPEPWGNVRSIFSSHLKACQIQADEIPSLVDEVPILSLVATQAHGTTIFHGVSELRIKETDRLSAIASELGKMGANITAEKDTLIIKGPTKLNPVPLLESYDDHRIAMTLRLAGLLSGQSPEIKGENCIAISYPNFHETLTQLS